MLTLNLELQKAIHQAFKEKTVSKAYYAWVWGSPRQASGIWINFLEETHNAHYIRVRVKPSSGRTAPSSTSLAETHYKCIQTATTPLGTISLLQLSPITGKTHQLRVQCAFYNLPIIGDQTYGAFGLNRQFYKLFKEKRLYLHASTLQANFKYKGLVRSFHASSNLPDAFTQLSTAVRMTIGEKA